MKHPFSVAVYCGSRLSSAPHFVNLAQEVGQWIGQRGGRLVYGGGNAGLMGQVAHATQQSGGSVMGVIPEALVRKELANDACDELHVVRNMHERKAMMAEEADMFLAIPGGIGTFEEFFEVWTWRQLGYHDKPIGLLNSHGYYDGLLSFMQHTVEVDFVSDWQMDLITVGSDAQDLLARLSEQWSQSRGDMNTDAI
ncbi:MAG: hypothetical protein RL357_1809 [Pseudomonadota bacterium]